MIYFDSAATSFLKPPQVAEAVAASFSSIGNAGRGAHAPTLNASRLIYRTREKLCRLFNGEDPSRFAFCCNVTEALNEAVNGLVGAGDHAITTAREHNSVLRPLYLARERGAELTILPVDANGNLDIKELEAAFRWNTTAVIMAHATNLTGSVTNIRQVSEIAHRHGAVLIIDAAQSAGALPIDVQDMGIDVLCFTGHKSLLGPQGTGGIYVKPGLQIPPYKVGGSGVHSFDQKHPNLMPTALEAGTVNGHGIAGLSAALDFLLETGVETIEAREQMLAQRFIDGIRNIPSVRIYGEPDALQRAPIVTINIGEADSAEVSDILWEDYEICVRAGAHCAPLMHAAMGTAEQGAVRFSFSYFNTEAEVDTAIRAIREIAGEV